MYLKQGIAFSLKGLQNQLAEFEHGLLSCFLSLSNLDGIYEYGSGYMK